MTPSHGASALCLLGGFIVIICSVVGSATSPRETSLFWMMLAISVPVEDEWANLPSVAHAAVTESYAPNIQLVSPRTCLRKKLVCRFSSHLHNLVVRRCFPLERDPYCCDWTWEHCAHSSHWGLESG